MAAGYKTGMPPLVVWCPALVFLLVSCVFAALYVRVRRRLGRARADLEAREREIGLLRQEQERTRAGMEAWHQRLLADLSRHLQESSLRNLELVQEQFRRYAEENLQKNLQTSQARAQGDLEKRQQAIDALLRPVRESLRQVGELMARMEAERKESRGALDEQLRQLAAANVRLLEQTGSLSMALKDNKSRGRWGELQLRRIVEMAGMLEHCDFEVQVSGAADESRGRPDMVIHLPGEQQIVIDAKAPMAAFLKLADGLPDAERTARVREHAQAVRARIRELGGREYHQLFKRSPEFVVLFLPNEDVLRAALEGDPRLFDLGMENHVVLATPSTLIPMLKTIACSWRQYRLTQEARNISEQGRRLCESAGVLLGHAGKLGGHLGKAVASYNSLLGSLESRLLPRTRELARMGAALGPADGDALSPLEAVPRLPQDPGAED